MKKLKIIISLMITLVCINLLAIIVAPDSPIEKFVHSHIWLGNVLCINLLLFILVGIGATIFFITE